MRIERLAFEGRPNPEPARERLQACMASPPEVFEPAPGDRTCTDRPGHACCTPLAKPRSVASCPACGAGGKLVKPVTLRALLQPDLRAEVRDEEYRFCPSPDCALVYFSADGSQTFARADLTVRVGVKERSGPRPLCYCFGHSAESIRNEWATVRKSTVIDAIKAGMKAGTCRCEVTNPGGACCLGDISREVKVLTANPVVPAPAPDCCAPSNSTPSKPSAGKESP